jgi:hypothetical protein
MFEQELTNDEIMALPKGDALHSNVLELLSIWPINLETKN